MVELKFKDPVWVNDGLGGSGAKVEITKLIITKQGEDYNFSRTDQQWAYLRGPREGVNTLSEAKVYAFNAYKDSVEAKYEGAFCLIESIERTFS